MNPNDHFSAKFFRQEVDGKNSLMLLLTVSEYGRSLAYHKRHLWLCSLIELQPIWVLFDLQSLRDQVDHIDLCPKCKVLLQFERDTKVIQTKESKILKFCIWLKSDSNHWRLIQSWLKSKLIQTFFKLDSDLIKTWFKSLESDSNLMQTWFKVDWFKCDLKLIQIRLKRD